MMQDFSASAMLRLIQIGLRRQGLENLLPRAGPDHRLDLNAKRDLLRDIRERHGLMPLLRIGEAVEEAYSDPILGAVLAARDATDLIVRWQRLERYVHSRHRTRLHTDRAGRMSLHHYNARGVPSPTLEEDALVFGLLIALIGQIGVGNLRARPEHMSDWAFHEGWNSIAEGDLSRWEIAFSDFVPAPPRLPQVGSTLSERLDALIGEDPSRGWTTSMLVSDIGMPARSLQRRLQQEGTNFREIRGLARSKVAGRMLMDGDTPLAAVGFHAGYADQAHFTREFKRLTGLTPAGYRENFGRSD